MLFADAKVTKSVGAPSPEQPARPKPRLLLVPNVSGWILGVIAREIALSVEDEFETIVASELYGRRDRATFHHLVQSADVIHALCPSAAQLVLDCGLDIDHRLVTWIHHVTKWTATHEQVVSRSAEIVATTPAWADFIRSYKPSCRPHVVGYGVDIERFTPRARRLRRVSDSRPFRIGYIGSATSDDDGGRKGLDVLFTVLTGLRDAALPFEIRFLGLGWESYARQLRHQRINAVSSGFLPASQLPQFYSSLDVCLVTSRVEGGPCSALEAMASGIPVVSTRVGMVASIIIDGRNGMTAEPGDSERIKEALLALARDQDLQGQLGEAGRQTVAPSFRWSTALRPLREVYRRVHEGPHGKQPDVLHLPIAARVWERSSRATDAVVWTAALVYRRRVSILAGIRMLASIGEGLGIRDYCRAVAGLVGRRRFPLTPPQDANSLQKVALRGVVR